MTTTAAERLMTADDLMRMPDDGFHKYELDRGRLITMSPAFSKPSMVAANVLTEVNAFVRSRKLGRCGGADWGFKLAADPDTVRAPDVGFVRAERIPPEGIARSYWPGPPDLAVEVRSASDRTSDVLKKVAEYLEAGTRLVWVLDPERRAALVFRPDGTVTVHGEDGVIDGEDVLPGFALPLADVWV
jgi:Uma2 family endonuclease